MENIVYLGLDIGTTTVSAVAVDARSGNVLMSRTVKSDADIPPADPREKMQDPKKIEATVCVLLEHLLQSYPQVAGIGLTGQMHGILYLDAQGEPVSPLYTWQDQRGAEACSKIRERTGYAVAPGYGLATHLALAEAGRLPEKASKLCTVMDYLAYTLCGRKKLLMHATNAASLGLFSLEDRKFDLSALKALDVSPEWLPEVTSEEVFQGTCRNIPVAVAIGDNQASFLGTVSQPETMALANFGTGSQISVLTETLAGVRNGGAMEVRPFMKDSYLVCGSALCGGRAYALLEHFFRSFVRSCGLGEHSCYEVLNTLAREGLQLSDLPEVTTTFCGTRENPDCRGSIQQLSERNLTPAALAAGTLLGMARELLEMFQGMPENRVSQLAVSGNAVRKNPALKQAVEETFGMTAQIPANQEEAAFGAALFAAAAAGNSMQSLRKQWIRYE